MKPTPETSSAIFLVPLAQYVVGMLSYTYRRYLSE